MALWGYLSAQIVREEWVLSLWLYEYTNIYKYIAIYDMEGGTTSLASDGAAQQVAKIAKNVRGKQSKNNCNPLTSVCVATLWRINTWIRGRARGPYSVVPSLGSAPRVQDKLKPVKPAAASLAMHRLLGCDDR